MAVLLSPSFFLKHPYTTANATELLGAEANGMATYFKSADGLGQVTVVDVGTPANNVTNVAADTWWTQVGTSPKIVDKADGTVAWSPHNLALYSEDLTNWTNVNTSDSGTTITASAGNAVHSMTRVPGTLITTLAYTAQVRLTPGTHNYAYLNVRGDASEDHVTVVADLSNGTISETDVGTTSGTIISSSAAAAGGGAYDIQVVFKVTAVSAPQFCVGLAAAASGNSFGVTGETTWNAAGTETIQATRAQLNRGRGPTVYMLTTSAAKIGVGISYADGAYGARIETAATNDLEQASDFSSTWVKSALTGTLTATGPDSFANTASTLTATSSNGWVGQWKSVSTATRVISIYAKRRTGTGSVYISQGDVTGSELITTNANFSLWTGDNPDDWTVTNEDGSNYVTQHAGGARFNASTGANLQLSRNVTTTVGKWYRVDAVITNFVATGAQLRIGGSGIGNASISSAGTKTSFVRATATSTAVLIFVNSGTPDFVVASVTAKEVAETEIFLTGSWQRFSTPAASTLLPTFMLRFATSGDAIDVALAQSEVGSLPTSAIQTPSAAVTRAADDISKVVTAFPFSATEGTIYVDYLPSAATGTQVVWQVSDGTANERILLYRSTNDPLIDVIDGGVSQLAPIDAGTIVGGIRNQTTFAWKANLFAASQNGGASVDDTSGTLPTVTTLRIGRDHSGNQLNGYIRRLVYVPRQIEEDADTVETWRYNF